MARFFDKIAGRTSPDPQAVEKLRQSEKQLEAANSRTSDIKDLTEYLAARREQNHFGDALSISFTPRRRHA